MASDEFRSIDFAQLRVSTQAAMRKLGQAYLRMSRERIESGIGSDGTQMPTYSAGYFKLKSAAGRDVTVRDLTFTGAMLAARRVKRASRADVTIGFVDGSQEALKAAGNEARTPFLKPTPDERDELVDLAQQYIAEQIKKDQDRLRSEKR